jgi:glycosyltransferase involved in cell wall biosynthesis
MGAMDAVLLYTDREAEEWRRLLPAHVNVTGAQNAVDQSDAQRLRADWSAAALTDFAQSQDLTGKRLLLFCGRLRQQPGTRLELAIRALPQLVAAHPEVVLVVIGDGERRHDLEQLAVQLGMTAHVRWLGPIYEEPQLAPWFLSAVCFVYPGSIGLSLLHAMGYGLPVITHDCERRHNPEIAALVPEVNGLVFHEDDAADLARQIRRVLGDDALRERLAAGALDTTTRVFTIDNMADRFLSAVRAARERSLRHAPAGRGP